MNRITYKLIVTMILAGYLAPTQGANKSEPPITATNILHLIPDETITAFIIPNVQDLFQHIKILVKDTTLPVPTDQLLTTLTNQIGIGHGFNPDGGLGFIAIDPKSIGITSEMIETNPAVLLRCTALIMCGNSALSVFPKFVSQKDDNTIVTLPNAPVMITKQIGPYLALSLDPKTLDKITISNRWLTTLSDKQANAIKTNHISICVDIKTYSQIAKPLTHVIDTAPTTFGLIPNLDKLLKNVIGNLKQFNTISLGCNLDAQGVSLHAITDCVEDSPLAQYLKSIKPAKSNLIDKLPESMWVLAGGIDLSSITKDLRIQNMMTLLINTPFFNLLNIHITPGISKKIDALISNYDPLITQIQFVGSGRTSDEPGYVATGLILTTKDANKTKQFLGQNIDRINEIIRAFGNQDNDLTNLTLTYIKDKNLSNNPSIDTIQTQNHNDLPNKTDKIQKILGQEKLQILVTAPNINTVILSLGGNRKYLTSLIDSSTGINSLATNGQANKALGKLPANCYCTALLSVQNLAKSISNIIGKHGLAIRLPSTCKTPLAVGIGLSGTTITGTIFVPVTAIKDISIYLPFLTIWGE